MYDIFTFQFDLVCDKSLLGTISTSVIFAGWLLGALAGGVLADKIGRKPVMFVFALMCSFFALLAAFPNVFWLFIVFRLLVGISIGKHNTTKTVPKTVPILVLCVHLPRSQSFSFLKKKGGAGKKSPSTTKKSEASKKLLQLVCYKRKILQNYSFLVKRYKS